MQYPYLKYFITIADCMSLSKAAQQIHISQQGLSSYLRRLEDYYQAELFVRKPVFALTPEGKLLLEKAKIIDESFEQLEEIFRMKDDDPIISVGVVSSALRYYTEKQLLSIFHAQYPNTLVRFVDTTPNDIAFGVIDNIYDFGCTNVMQPQKALSYERLFTQEFLLVVSDSTLREIKGDTLCLDELKKGVDLGDFLDIPYFGYPNSYVVTKLLHNYCEQEKKTLITRLENPTAEATMQMVMSNKGFTLLVADRLPLFQNHAGSCSQPFYSFPIKSPTLEVPYYLVSKKDRPHPSHTRELMSLTRRLLSAP